MSKPARAWALARSLQWAMVIGILTGLALAGLTYTGFAWDLEPQQSILVGAGVAIGLSLFLTYLFDRVSLGVGSFRSAVKGRQNSTKDGDKA
jgi:uncharacterized membrane protein YedE/YeeE